MYEQRNLLKKDKMPYADTFRAKFDSEESFEHFIDFLKAPEIAVQGNYGETWNFIKADTNSLKRYTNFQLFFSNPKNARTE